MTERDEIFRICAELRQIAHRLVGGDPSAQSEADAFTLGQAAGLLLKLSRPRDGSGRYVSYAQLKREADEKGVYQGSGNVFKDLNCPNPEALLAEAWVRPPHPWPWPDEDALEADQRLGKELWLKPPRWKRIVRVVWVLVLVVAAVALASEVALGIARIMVDQL